MKIVALRVASLAVILGVLAACGGSSRVVSLEEAEEALFVGFGAAFVGSMSASVGRPLPGVSMNQQTGALTLADFDVIDFETPYRSVSGTVSGSGSGAGSSKVELKLTGGPVQTLNFELTAAQLQNPGGFLATVKVNGKNTEIRVPAAWFQ